MGRSLSRTERPVVSKGSGAATRFEPLGVDGIYGKPTDENVVQETSGRAEDRPRNQARTFPFPKGESMSTALIRILIVGPSTSGTDGIVKELTGAGWGSHSVASVVEAETVLKTSDSK